MNFNKIEKMKTVQVNIKLYQFDELPKDAQEDIIHEHGTFLSEVGIQFDEDEWGECTMPYEPDREEIIESIRCNEYWFHENGDMAHTVKYTGDHPKAGTTVYFYNGIEIPF